MTKIAPPHSYIDASQFGSAEELARYLLYLDGNTEEYLKYFWWKEYYEIQNTYLENVRNAYCKLCEILNDETAPSMSYNDIHKWWEKYSYCQ